MNSKVRCTNCRGYMERSECFWQGPNGMNRMCTERCFNEWRDRKKPKQHEVKARRRKTPKPSLPINLRVEVRQRDGQVCRWCGTHGEQVHHIHYRSEGGPDHPHNLILLCREHHELVHTNKKVFKPLLLAYIWLVYTEGRKHTIPSIVRRLDRLGELSDAQREVLSKHLSFLLAPADT